MCVRLAPHQLWGRWRQPCADSSVRIHVGLTPGCPDALSEQEIERCTLGSVHRRSRVKHWVTVQWGQHENAWF